LPENTTGESFIRSTEYLLQIDLKKALKEKFWAHPDLNANEVFNTAYSVLFSIKYHIFSDFSMIFTEI